MSEAALWKRLDAPGHDAALLAGTGTGWSLRGAAVFSHALGPACVSYAVDLDASWQTLRGEVSGFLGTAPVRHVVTREGETWCLDGDPVPGLEHLVDLDFGFTPATNMQQLRRVAIAPGQAADLPVAWLDLGSPTLTELPQRYERLDATTYRYMAPTVGYAELLELAASGFARRYPLLWTMEA